jgi:hypothetical protein
MEKVEKRFFAATARDTGWPPVVTRDGRGDWAVLEGEDERGMVADGGDCEAVCGDKSAIVGSALECGAEKHAGR